MPRKLTMSELDQQKGKRTKVVSVSIPPKNKQSFLLH